MHNEERQRRVAELVEQQSPAELAEKVVVLQDRLVDALVADLPQEERRARVRAIFGRGEG
jgi:hypothetical protein